MGMNRLKMTMANLPFISLADAEPPFYAGIDLGGTNIKCGIVDNRGRPLSYLTTQTCIELGPEQGAQRMAEATGQAALDAGLKMSQIARVGLATPGTMDIPRGILLNPVNLPGWENFPIRDRVAQHTGRPVAYANDANAAAYGEFWVGSGVQLCSMIMLTLGTGVGGGIIVDGHTIDGENSHGSECGHIIVDSRDDARLCSCGHTGHLEAYASATSVARRTQEALSSGHPSSLNRCQEEGLEVTALRVHQAAESGDELALEIILETARYLGIGITTLLHTIDPAAVVLGGAMNFGGVENRIGKRFLEAVRQEVARRAFPVISAHVQIGFASLGGNAGYIGAAGIAKKQEELS